MEEYAKICFWLGLAGIVTACRMVHQRYKGYLRSDWYRFKERVEAHGRSLHQRRRDLSKPIEYAARLRFAYEFHLLAYFDTITALDQLTAFPGIGPGTVQSLRQSGAQNLAGLRQMNLLEIPGIGPKKSDQIRHACEAILGRAQTTFDGGRCQEAQRYAREHQSIVASAQTQEANRVRDLRHIDNAISAFATWQSLAAQISFRKYFTHQHIHGLTAALIHQPMPN